MKILLTTLNSKYVHSCLALKYLERTAEDTDLDINVREFTINNSRDYIYTEIVRNGYDLICFSCYIWNIEMIKVLASDLKKADPGLKLLFGGPEVSYNARSFMEEHDFADFILRGEGEYSFRSFCGELEKEKCSFADVKGLTYRDKAGEIHENEDAPVLPMDDIPFPYKEEPERDKVVYYESSRGCPYRCSYCLSSIDKRVRSLSLGRTLKDLDYFLGLNLKQVKFIDRTFNYDADKAYKVWEYLINHDNGVTNFHFEICGELITEKQIELLAKARKGLFQLEIGVQSTNPDVLRAVNRRPATERLFRSIRKIKEAGNIHVHVDLIAGLPYEDYDSFAKSFNDVFALGADNLQLGFLKVLKGTGIEQDASEHGMVYRDAAPYEIIGNRYISPAELAKLKMIESVLDLYSNKEGFEETLSYMIPALGAGPFDFFSKFADFFYENGFQHRSHKKEDLYRIMLKFAASEEDVCKGITKKAEELLSADLENTMNFDAVKKFYKKGWEIYGF